MENFTATTEKIQSNAKLSKVYKNINAFNISDSDQKNFSWLTPYFPLINFINDNKFCEIYNQMNDSQK